MIYTVFSFVNNKDCHKLWQSSTEYSDSLSSEKFLDKSWLIKAERQLANLLLTIGLDKFFSVKEWDIEIDSHGKPRLVNYTYDGVIHINVSHSLGAVAVCLSDTNELGVDIQTEIDPNVQERLEKRFFKDVKVSNQPLGVRYFTLSDDGDLSDVTLNSPNDSFDFTDKWAYSESVMKCDGSGFLVSSGVKEISKEFVTEIKKITTEKKAFSIAISTKKPL